MNNSSLLLLTVIISACAAQQVYLSLGYGSTNIMTNNTEILITDIGEDAGGLPSLICHTDFTACCRSYAENNGNGGLGQWTYPNGSVILNNPGSTAVGELFYIVRNAPQLIRLARRQSSNPLSPTGSYCCTIPTTGGEMIFCAKLVVCLSFPPLTNGMISYSDPTPGVGSMATFSCEPRYRLIGENTRTCHDGWSGYNSFCQVFSCGSPPPIFNGSLEVPVNVTIGSSVTYDCSTGYELVGSAIIHCQSTGRWTMRPRCLLIICGAPPPILNGSHAIPSTFVLGGNVSYSCDYEYEFSAGVRVTNATCQADGNWTSLICKPVTCGPPPPIPNGSPGTPTSTILRGTVIYSCDSGYELFGSTTATCEASGSWTLRPICAAVSCGLLPTITNGSPRTPTSTTFGGTVTYSCDTGYKLVPLTAVTCQASRRWSTLPMCTIVSCGLPPLVANGSCVHSGFTFEENAIYNCDNGYNISGTSTISCQANGRRMGGGNRHLHVLLFLVAPLLQF
ncbi:sushi, von Willebrand factor type A, EGF and pentraxin domain-containing protein 1-like isoform X2 [Halichondria panicea]|uniref:sushi, von Willebrand factor type A, EGF and pentraxin domain-containing protein 1-like isoform X2 n=1 Tax=Halichondria panicea TaxID=6063 RepID=UPI00312B965D